MNIYGFQKMTMLDFPGRVAATVFTGGCNFRCPFCHNSDLVTDINPGERLTEEEIFDYLDKRRGILDGVAITGGEPLLNVDIGVFISKIRALGLKVKLDTNGTFPERLEKLIDAGLLDYVAVDIKNSKEKYALTAGVKQDFIPLIEKTVAILKENRVDYEFRTTVVSEYHTLEDFYSIGEMIKGSKNYFIQCFKDSGKLISGDKMNPPTKDFMREAQKIVSEFVENVEIRGID